MSATHAPKYFLNHLLETVIARLNAVTHVLFNFHFTIAQINESRNSVLEQLRVAPLRRSFYGLRFEKRKAASFLPTPGIDTKRN